MITTKLEGRLGNQMFQIANCIAYSLRHGMQYAIPQFTGNTELWPVYFSHFPKLQKNDFGDFGVYREINHGFNEIPKREQICFNGYFQSYKYWWDYKDIILQAFEPGFSGVIDKGFDYTGKVSIHVRRGDYVELKSMHPPVSIEYIKKAVLQMEQLGYNQFTVYSDDPAWCEENLIPAFDSIEELQHINLMVLNQPLKDPVKDALFDFYTMSKHEHNIISNSTFSWWAAMMNKNKQKIVITPSIKNWFGADYANLDLQNFILPQWIQVEY